MPPTPEAQLHAAGRDAVLSRTHGIERSPEVTGRWARRPIERCAAAMERAGAAEPPPFRFSGLCLSPGSTMACASVDDRADGLRSRLASELGDDGWFEDRVFPNGRDPFWYVSLVHFARPVDRARELVDWVEVRRTLEIGHQTFDDMALCSWSFDGAAMAPVALARAAIRGGTPSRSDRPRDSEPA